MESKKSLPPVVQTIQLEENLKLSVAEGRKSFIDPLSKTSRLFHEEIEIKYFFEGSSTLLIGKETIVTSPGDIVIINPYEFHSTVDFGEDPGKYHLFMVGLDFFAGAASILPDLRNLFFVDRVRFQTLVHGDTRLSEILCRIVTEMHDRQVNYEAIVYGLVAEFFSILLRHYRTVEPLELPTGKNIRYYHIIHPAIHKIRTDYAEHISIDDLAIMCNISKYHFCRIFKEVTSRSAVQYQNEYRLQIADILLKTTKKSISEISSICGFDDLCYFSRCYKKCYGVSPQANRAILSK